MLNKNKSIKKLFPICIKHIKLTFSIFWSLKGSCIGLCFLAYIYIIIYYISVTWPKKSDHVELPGADETRSVKFILMICAWLRGVIRPSVKIINLLHILVHLECFITIFFLLKTNCNSFTYATIWKLFFKQLYFRKTLKTDNIHCVLRLQFQTVMIRILKKKSHCSSLKNHTLYN